MKRLSGSAEPRPMRFQAVPKSDRRALMAIPRWEQLSDSLRHRLSQASAALDQVEIHSADVVRTSGDDRFAQLEHELSGHFQAMHAIREERNRSDLECSVLDRLDQLTEPGWLASDLAFIRGCERLNQALAGAAGGLRKHDNIGIQTATGYTLYPSRSLIPARMQILRSLCQAGQDRSGLVFRAALAKAVLTNIHPFNDGNGRLARLLFNMILRNGGMRHSAYIPFSEIAERSRGGYHIRIRLAELRGDFEPFLEYVANLVMLAAELREPGSKNA